MIIIDFQQIIIANLMVSFSKTAEIDENIIRHMVLSSLRKYRIKFKKEYGDIVIACDSKESWRKNIFPHYKASRKKLKDSSPIDWKLIYKCIDTIKSEIAENFPYPVIEIDGAEADDVIATLTSHLDGSHVIISTDKDFIQLHHKNVKQYDPVKSSFVSHSNPKLFLMEHILRGDVGDGVPNVLSKDNCFVEGIRQKPLSSKKIGLWVDSDIESCLDINTLRNYHRNNQMINLSLVPSEIREKIINKFNEQSGKRRNHLLPYFIKNRLKNLMINIGDF
jgi:hypothetical protein